MWSEYLRRWLNFRRWLYREHQVPASFELHSQEWLSVAPGEHLSDDQAAQVMSGGELVPVLQRGRAQRRERFQIFEKAIRTIGGFTEAAVFTVFSEDPSGASKLALYDDLLCFVEEFLVAERAHATLIVDGAHDSGGHLRAAHRALRIKERRIVEDAAQRRSSESQLLQMADLCVHAAFQSLQNPDKLDAKFRRQYEERLSRLIVRPFLVDEGRCVRGFDYVGDTDECPSEHVASSGA
jgi:hypothetical protein